MHTFMFVSFPLQWHTFGCDTVLKDKQTQQHSTPNTRSLLSMLCAHIYAFVLCVANDVKIVLLCAFVSALRNSSSHIVCLLCLHIHDRDGRMTSRERPALSAIVYVRVCVRNASRFRSKDSRSRRSNLTHAH